MSNISLVCWPKLGATLLLSFSINLENPGIFGIGHNFQVVGWSNQDIKLSSLL
ncbi:hypothetical protein OAQ56_02415 [Alphaproteobacteria bacterium]|nr:hypothetical protein [Alphaproteobacteria bacterium]